MSAEDTLEDPVTKKIFDKYLKSLSDYVSNPTDENKTLTKVWFEQYLSMLTSGELNKVPSHQEE